MQASAKLTVGSRLAAPGRANSSTQPTAPRCLAVPEAAEARRLADRTGTAAATVGHQQVLLGVHLEEEVAARHPLEAAAEHHRLEAAEVQSLCPMGKSV